MYFYSQGCCVVFPGPRGCQKVIFLGLVAGEEAEREVLATSRWIGEEIRGLE